MLEGTPGADCHAACSTKRPVGPLFPGVLRGTARREAISNDAEVRELPWERTGVDSSNQLVSREVKRLQRVGQPLEVDAATKCALRPIELGDVSIFGERQAFIGQVFRFFSAHGRKLVSVEGVRVEILDVCNEDLHAGLLGEGGLVDAAEGRVDGECQGKHLNAYEKQKLGE